MAVSKVRGRANGIDIIFERMEGDFWTIQVPSNKYGEYVVEIMAIDDAGNESYQCSMLFVIEKGELRAYILPSGFTAEAVNTGLEAWVLEHGYTASMIQGGVIADAKDRF